MSMFIKTLCITVFLFLLTADMSLALEYKARKKTADYTVEMSIDRNPPIVDKNILSLEIKDTRGQHVTDAKVLVNYYMPPMPGMPPMNYKTSAKLSGNKYIVLMDLIMSGPWNIVIKISRTGKTETVRFAIDVR
jgi:hypothetical protein